MPHPPGSCSGPSSAAPFEDKKHLGNCKAYESHTVGTFDHFTHLILPNVLYWNSSVTLAQILCRASRPWGRNNISYSWINTYMEANIGAEVSYPQGIKMMIANFPQLFGSYWGMLLQDWCIKRGWVLV